MRVIKPDDLHSHFVKVLPYQAWQNKAVRVILLEIALAAPY
ncbi:MAG: hypothetical protein ACU83U_02775 [Gammaproteobacteria bacterium]